MSIDSASKGLPRRNRRGKKRNTPGEISPGLRKHITEAAEEIRAAHHHELADVMKADQAGRLFRGIICANGEPVDSPKQSTGVSVEGMGSLADEVGGLVSNTIRAGTGLVEGSLAVLARAWMATLKGPLTSNRGMSSSAGLPFPTPSRQSSTPVMPAGDREAVAPGNPPHEMPMSNPEEVMVQGVLRQFMPMLLTAINEGGDGYGLARTVITLFGRSTYDQASKLGKDKIMQLVKGEPDLWAQVAPIEHRFSRFLAEFTSYDLQADVRPQGRRE